MKVLLTLILLGLIHGNFSCGQNIPRNNDQICSNIKSIENMMIFDGKLSNELRKIKQSKFGRKWAQNDRYVFDTTNVILPDVFFQDTTQLPNNSYIFCEIKFASCKRRGFKVFIVLVANGNIHVRMVPRRCRNIKDSFCLLESSIDLLFSFNDEGLPKYEIKPITVW